MLSRLNGSDGKREEEAPSTLAKLGKTIASVFKPKKEVEKPVAKGPCINPEALTEQKREWMDLQAAQVQFALATWPDHLFEHFFVIGLPPDVEVTRIAQDLCAQERRSRHEVSGDYGGPGAGSSGITGAPSGIAGGDSGVPASSYGGAAGTAQYPSQYDKAPKPSYDARVLFRHPAAKPAPLSDQELVDLCFPHKVAPFKLRRSPSMSSLHEVVYGRHAASRDDQCFIFLLKVGTSLPLYGICCAVPEVLHRPPHLARHLYPTCRMPFRSVMIAAPRVYCLLSHYPFFDLHFQVLNVILGMERLHRTIDFNAELDAGLLPAPSTSRPTSAAGAHGGNGSTGGGSAATAVTAPASAISQMAASQPSGGGDGGATAADGGVDSCETAACAAATSAAAAAAAALACTHATSQSQSLPPEQHQPPLPPQQSNRHTDHPTDHHSSSQIQTQAPSHGQQGQLDPPQQRHGRPPASQTRGSVLLNSRCYCQDCGAAMVDMYPGLLQPEPIRHSQSTLHISTCAPAAAVAGAAVATTATSAASSVAAGLGTPGAGRGDAVSGPAAGAGGCGGGDPFDATAAAAALALGAQGSARRLSDPGSSPRVRSSGGGAAPLVAGRYSSRQIGGGGSGGGASHGGGGGAACAPAAAAATAVVLSPARSRELGGGAWRAAGGVERLGVERCHACGRLLGPLEEEEEEEVRRQQEEAPSLREDSLAGMIESALDKLASLPRALAAGALRRGDGPGAGLSLVSVGSATVGGGDGGGTLAHSDSFLSSDMGTPHGALAGAASMSARVLVAGPAEAVTALASRVRESIKAMGTAAGAGVGVGVGVGAHRRKRSSEGNLAAAVNGGGGAAAAVANAAAGCGGGCGGGVLEMPDGLRGAGAGPGGGGGGGAFIKVLQPALTCTTGIAAAAERLRQTQLPLMGRYSNLPPGAVAGLGGLDGCGLASLAEDAGSVSLVQQLMRSVMAPLSPMQVEPAMAAAAEANSPPGVSRVASTGGFGVAVRSPEWPSSPEGAAVQVQPVARRWSFLQRLGSGTLGPAAGGASVGPQAHTSRGTSGGATNSSGGGAVTSYGGSGGGGDGGGVNGYSHRGLSSAFATALDVAAAVEQQMASPRPPPAGHSASGCGGNMGPATAASASSPPPAAHQCAEPHDSGGGLGFGTPVVQHSGVSPVASPAVSVPASRWVTARGDGAGACSEGNGVGSSLSGGGACTTPPPLPHRRPLPAIAGVAPHLLVPEASGLSAPYSENSFYTADGDDDATALTQEAAAAAALAAAVVAASTTAPGEGGSPAPFESPEAVGAAARVAAHSTTSHRDSPIAGRRRVEPHLSVDVPAQRYGNVVAVPATAAATTAARLLASVPLPPLPQAPAPAAAATGECTGPDRQLCTNASFSLGVAEVQRSVDAIGQEATAAGAAAAAPSPPPHRRPSSGGGTLLATGTSALTSGGGAVGAAGAGAHPTPVLPYGQAPTPPLAAAGLATVATIPMMQSSNGGGMVSPPPAGVAVTADMAHHFSPRHALDQLYNHPIINPGEQLTLRFGGVATLQFTRPILGRRFTVVGPPRAIQGYAEAELAEGLQHWTTAVLCRSLSLDNLMLLLTAALLERQVVVFCPHISVLSCCVLGLLPLLRPFCWQSLMLPVTPVSMIGFLEAPVPFVLGVQYKTSDVMARCFHLVRVNVYKDQIKNAGPALPQLPGLKRLATALAPYHALLRRRLAVGGGGGAGAGSGAGQGATAAALPSHAGHAGGGGEAAGMPQDGGRSLRSLSPSEHAATTAFLLTVSQHLSTMCGDLRPHVITNVGLEKRTGVLMKESLMEVVAPKDKPFVRQFIETQMFSVWSDALISANFEGSFGTG